MKFWIGPALLALYMVPQWGAKTDKWGNPHDVYVFESGNSQALAVVTPDPFLADPEWPMRVWRAEVHIRVGGTTVTEEISFRAKTIERDTVLFLETAWGPEVHIFEAHPDLGPDALRRRRWVAGPEGLEALQPVRGHGPY